MRPIWKIYRATSLDSMELFSDNEFYFLGLRVCNFFLFLKVASQM